MSIKQVAKKFQHKVNLIVNISGKISNTIWFQWNIPSVLKFHQVSLHVHLNKYLTCFHSNALQNMDKNYICVIFNTLIFRRRPKRGQNNMLLLIIWLWWYNNNNQSEIVNQFLWIIMNFFCLFLWSWWRGETISGLLLNLYIEYLTLSLVDGYDTSLFVTFNTISEFWSVYKILSNKSSWMRKYSWSVEVPHGFSGLPIKAYPYLFTKWIFS